MNISYLFFILPTRYMNDSYILSVKQSLNNLDLVHYYLDDSVLKIFNFCVES